MTEIESAREMAVEQALCEMARSTYPWWWVSYSGDHPKPGFRFVVMGVSPDGCVAVELSPRQRMKLVSDLTDERSAGGREAPKPPSDEILDLRARNEQMATALWHHSNEETKEVMRRCCADCRTVEKQIRDAEEGA
jgi:hypothetical protein